METEEGKMGKGDCKDTKTKRKERKGENRNT